MNYLANSTYSDQEKDCIMRLAKELYCNYGFKNTKNGWDVCEDSDRTTAVYTATSLFLIVRPFLERRYKDGKNDVWSEMRKVFGGIPFKKEASHD